MYLQINIHSKMLSLKWSKECQKWVRRSFRIPVLSFTMFYELKGLYFKTFSFPKTWIIYDKNKTSLEVEKNKINYKPHFWFILKWIFLVSKLFKFLLLNTSSENLLKLQACTPVDAGRKLNVHKTFRRRLGRLLNVLCTFNLRPVSTGTVQ